MNVEVDTAHPTAILVPATNQAEVQLAAGGSYLATERAAAGCSYGAVPASCRVAPAGGRQTIVDRAVETLQTMFPKKDG